MKNLILYFSIFLFVEKNVLSQHILIGKNLQDSSLLKNAVFVKGKIENGDTILQIEMKEFVVVPPMKFKTEKEARKYSKLERQIRKVYPYAKMVKLTLMEIEHRFETLKTEKERKTFFKQKEKELFGKFEKELVNLTISEGKILLKLVDRETGKTTYQIIKELKGSFSAFFWQTIAKIVGDDLKSEYDSEGEDRMIEDIIFRIENEQPD